MTTRTTQKFTDGQIITKERNGTIVASFPSCYVLGRDQQGGNTLNFKSIKPGSLPVNNYTTTIFKSELGIVDIRSYYIDVNTGNIETRTVQGTNDYSAAVTEKGDVAVDSVALANRRILEACKSVKVNLAQALAESSQVARLVSTTAVRLSTTINCLRKGNFMGAVKALQVSSDGKGAIGQRFNRSFQKDKDKAVSQAWLELQYGWKPLLSDIYGTAEFFAERALKRQQTILEERQSGKVKRTFYDKYRLVNVDTNRIDIRDFRGDFEARSHCSIKYVIDNPSHNLAHKFGLTNPALLAWELVPYSFVVDWFLPIGKYLEQIGQTAGLKFISGHTTTIKRSIYSGFETANTLTPAFVFDSKTVAGRKEIIYMERRKIGGFPAPIFPVFKNPVSFLHAANAIALLTTSFKR